MVEKQPQQAGVKNALAEYQSAPEGNAARIIGASGLLRSGPVSASCRGRELPRNGPAGETGPDFFIRLKNGLLAP